MASPVTVVLAAEPPAAAVSPSRSDVTVYWVIGLPPSDAGMAQPTMASPFPAVAVTPVGLRGTVLGVTLLELVDGSPAPIALLAAAMKV